MDVLDAHRKRHASFHVGREKTGAAEIVWENQTPRFFKFARPAM
ncbi:hypothetical protein [Burkholderia stagnalis]|nr:hypothetical protein [Burkholderia stagnalis]